MMIGTDVFGHEYKIGYFPNDFHIYYVYVRIIYS